MAAGAGWDAAGSVRERELVADCAGEAVVHDGEVVGDVGGEAVDAGDGAEADAGGDQRVLDHVLAGVVAEKLDEQLRAGVLCGRCGRGEGAHGHRGELLRHRIWRVLR